jgi:exopolysaccharide biosynthesis WecB/TagA/CpsF family protein
MRASIHTTAIALRPREFDERLPANDSYTEVVVGGLKTVCLSRPDLARLMVRDCLSARSAKSGPRTVFAANGHAVAFAATDKNFQRLFDEADIVHADGQAIVFASRLMTKTPIAERSATTDFIHDAAEAAVHSGLKFFLFGATEEVNKGAAEALKMRYPDLEIAGRRHGYFSPDEEEAICEEINASGADVVWLGLSVPLEYEFAARNKHRLDAGWIVTCGGCFNFLSGAYVRAPNWMQVAGLEWLHRLLRDPKRLFWRYAFTNPVALAMLIARTVEANQDTPPLIPAEVQPKLARETRFAR